MLMLNVSKIGPKYLGKLKKITLGIIKNWQ